ncbi:MAG: 3-hexulose-6-phosphate synthase [Blautia sp.]
MKLQLALDCNLSLESAKELARVTEDSVEILEAGTPFIYEWGMEGVRMLKEAFPQKTVVADLKIADAGYLEAELAFRMGADIITVLGVTEDATIVNALMAARSYGKKVMVDMMAVKDLRARLKEIDSMGVDYICLHTSKDLQKLGQDVSQAFDSLKGMITRARLVLAGGISRENIEKYAAIHPDVIVVGEGITAQKDSGAAAAGIRRIMDQNERR